MKILNFGSLNIDFVYKVEHIVKEGETISSNSLNTFCGGKGLNQSIAIARAGGLVYHAGKVGQDGSVLIDALKKDKINTDFILINDGKSGNAIIQVDKNGQNSIVLFGGANLDISENDIDKVLANFAKDDILLLQNEISSLPYIIEKASSIGMEIAFNPSPIKENLRDIKFENISMLFINEIEGKELSGYTKPCDIVNELIKKYPNTKIILTLGKDGVLYKDKDKTIEQQAIDAKVVDTTAAGDTFTGYFLTLYSQGVKIKEILLEASKASAICVSKVGASSSIPFRG